MRALHVSIALTTVILVAPSARADDLDALARAIDANPGDARAYDAYASAAIKAKRYDDAIHRLKIAVARISDYPEGYYKLGYAYRQKREWADAADYYRRYVALNPARTDTYYGLGAALEGLGDNKGAIAAYDKYVALEKSPDKQRFVDSARAELVKLDPSRAPAPLPPPPPPPSSIAPPPSSPSSSGSLRAQAEELRRTGRLAEAASAYRRAIEADRGNLDLYNDLGNVYFALKQYGDAATAFADATHRDPNYALGWYNLAHALRKGDRAREAADAYRQYIRLKPDDPDPYYGLGQTLKMLGDAPGAMAAFRKYIGMEKRPEEQRWVDKARAELQALEAMQPKPAQPSGKIEEKSSGGDDARDKLDRELRRDAVMPPAEEIIDPFEHSRLKDLKDPFRPNDDLVDPFGRERSLSQSTDQLRQYGAALAAYRRALSRHAENVSLRFERGVASVLASNTPSALRAWNTVPLEDPDVAAARQSVERIRRALPIR